VDKEGQFENTKTNFEAPKQKEKKIIGNCESLLLSS